MEQQQQRRRQSQAETDALLDASACMVVVNGECHTAWNARKKLVRSGTLALSSELAFSRVVLQRHKKSSTTWAHRRWLLDRLGGEEFLRAASLEYALCEELAAAYSRNYQAWHHRQLISERLCGHGQHGALKRDMESAAAWLAVHEGDSSAQHYMARLDDLIDHAWVEVSQNP